MKVAALRAPFVNATLLRQFRLNETIQITPVEQLTAGWDAALIFGGDGTIHLHLPQLHANGIPALIVPCGSGNDFAHSLGIHSISIALRAWQRFCSEKTNIREIDLGLIQQDDRETLFCCVAGAGLDAKANARANRMPASLRSTAGYLIAALQALVRLEPLEIQISADGRKEKQSALFLAVANASRYGNGMKVAPKAELDDGKLDVCLVRRMNKLKALFCLPAIYFGAHLRLREVTYFQSQEIAIDSVPRLELYADGEYVCETPARINVVPHAMQVIYP